MYQSTSSPGETTTHSPRTWESSPSEINGLLLGIIFAFVLHQRLLLISDYPKLHYATLSCLGGERMFLHKMRN